MLNAELNMKNTISSMIRMIKRKYLSIDLISKDNMTLAGKRNILSEMGLKRGIKIIIVRLYLTIICLFSYEIKHAFKDHNIVLSRH